MLKPLPQPSTMQSLRRLLLRHNTKLLSLSRSRILLPPHQLVISHLRLFSSDGSTDPDLSAWAAYDPFGSRGLNREADSEAVDKDLSEAAAAAEEMPRLSQFSEPPAEVLITPEEKSPQKRNKPGEDLDGKGGRVSLGPSLEGWSPAVRKKMGKVKVTWVCGNCGESQGQWWGTCPSCQKVGSMKEFSEAEICRARGTEVSEAAVKSWLPQRPGGQMPQRLTEVNQGKDQSDWRIPLSGHFGMEVARVLGGGIVPGSLVLVGGDPGVGKSTLLLQIAANIAEGHDFKGPAPVVYVSGEESIEQIGHRADRMGIKTEEVFLYSSTDIEDILNKIQVISPVALIVDSIQTVYLKGVTGSAGNIMQVKECTSALLRFAKQTSIPVFLIGHVTKSGDIAGPRILEHIVDTVLYMEGERYSSYRLLRPVKNRFGSTDELGVLEMLESGMHAVSNPSEMFISERHTASEILAGLAVAVVVDGSRAFVIEIQALCAPDSSVGRHVNGLKENRAAMIISVLMKQAGLKLQSSAIFLNVVSGFKMTETAGDLAVAAAICSSFLEFPIPDDIAFIGEIGLGGELRAVGRMDKRLMAVAKLGYKRCVIPKTGEKLLTSLNLGIQILGCRTLKEVINTVFRAD